MWGWKLLRWQEIFKREFLFAELSSGTIKVIISGQIIEDYPEDEPCPSALFFAYCEGRPFHVVVAECKDHIRIICTSRKTING
jgi:hypothetical protein